MRKIAIAAAAALALSAATFAPSAMLAQSAQTWLVTATITLGGQPVMDPLYYHQADPATRFADEASCDAFRKSDDATLKAANDGLKAQVVATFGEEAKIEFSCTVEPQ